jgi:uncharacterized protein YutE (UPF0331/DUF86 family)
MTPKVIAKRIVADRLDTVNYLLGEIQALPLQDLSAFLADRRNIWAAESCLRRSLEALFDIGRHILAKGYGLGISQYKEIATQLQEKGILSEKEAALMQVLAGYRNRLVHFYHEVSAAELHEVCAHRLGDLEVIVGAYRRWLKEHPDKIDSKL